MESIELKKFLLDIGDSVHSMNTIAVALSLLPNEKVKVPDGLEISWDPKNLTHSKLMARNYAERSSYVYAVESLFEYIDNISKNPFWNYPELNFRGKEKKALKVYNFIQSTPGSTETMAILVELLCHWRNRVVHLNISNAGISSRKKDHLLSEKELIYSKFHHYDVNKALENFEQKKVTLKDASTLITVAIKSARIIDSHFFNGIAKKDIETLNDYFSTDTDFQLIIKQPKSKKKDRQIKHWLNLNYPYLTLQKTENILKKLKLSP